MSNAIATANPQRYYSLPLIVADVLTFVLMAGIAIGDEVLPWAPTVTRAAGVLLVLLYLPCHLFYRLKVPLEWVLFAVFVVWGGVCGLLVAVEPQACWLYVRFLAQHCALALAVSGFCTAKRSPAFVFLVLMIWGISFGIYSWFTGFYEAGFAWTQIGGVDTPWNPNAFGLQMLRAIMGAAYFWGMRKGRYFQVIRLLLIPTAVFITFVLLSSGSRKSFAALLCFILLWLWFCYKRYVFRSPRAIAVVVGVLVATYYLTTYVREETRLGLRLELTLEEGGLGETRTRLYVRAAELFLQHPIAGVGLGNFVVVSGEDLYTHSDYMEVLSTTGIVGALLYFPIYFVLWRRLSRIGKTTTDPEVKYHMGLFKATILTTLALGIGVPNFLQSAHWLLMAGIIGYSYAIDPQRSALAAPSPARAAPPAALPRLTGRLAR